MLTPYSPLCHNLGLSCDENGLGDMCWCDGEGSSLTIRCIMVQFNENFTCPPSLAKDTVGFDSTALTLKILFTGH